jgi:hypothetical protein
MGHRLVFSGHCWADLGEKSAKSGLQPFLLSGGDGGPGRPRDFGELVSDPEDTTAIEGVDAARELEWWWDAQFPGEDAGDGELRAMFAPFGARFPGLAPAIEEETGPGADPAGTVPVHAGRADRAGAGGAPG